MTYKSIIDSLRDAAYRCDSKAIFALAARVSSEDLKKDKELEEAYRIALQQVND